MKKIIIAVALLGILGAVAYVGWPAVEERREEAMRAACRLDLGAISFENLSAKKLTDREAAESVFKNYFFAYTRMPDCPTSGIADFKLVSVDGVRRDGNDIYADVTFDLKPLSMKKTEWKTPETTVDGDWIRGKKGTLGITQIENIYYLSL